MSLAKADDASPRVPAVSQPNHIRPLYQLQVAGDFASGPDPKNKSNVVCRGQALLGGLVQLRGEGDNYLTCSVVKLN